MDMKVIAAVALVMAGLVSVVLCVVVPLILCLWCKTRRELEILKRRVEYKVGRSDNQYHVTSGLTEYTEEPPSGTYAHLEHSPPSPIKPREKDTASNYMVVNNLAILPDELRTVENLEVGELPEDTAHQMMEEYLKKRQEYEEIQLSSSSPKQQTTPESEDDPPKVEVQPKSNSPPQRRTHGYEEVDPAEPPSTTTSEAKESSRNVPPQSLARPTPGYENTDPVEPLVGNVETAPERKKQPRVGDYNNPIDCLPSNHPLADKITGKSSFPKKASFQLSTSADDYTEVFDSLTASTGNAPLPQVRPSGDKTCDLSNGSPMGCQHVYENGPAQAPSSSPPGGGLKERGDTTRQSKRDSGKEVVELDFSKKKFRVTSKNSTKMDDTTKETIDGEASPKDRSPRKTEESYAVVNLADKQRYRAESDSMKKEGSGFPTHYGPGEQHAVVAVST